MTSVKSTYWFPGCGVEVKDINLEWFTHLYYGFAEIDPNSYITFIPAKDMVPFSTFSKDAKLKKSNIRTFLSIGGSTSQEYFSTMASNPSNRSAFISTANDLARSHGFSGLDLHWMYPASQQEMENFTILLKEWKKANEDDADKNQTAPLHITASVYMSSTISPGIKYQVDEIKSTLRWINLIAYDFYTPATSDRTGPSAALHNPRDSKKSVDSGLRDWTNDGMLPTKIVIGLPCFGYKWQLKDKPKGNGLFDNSYITKDVQMMLYREIKAITDGGTERFEESYATDYLYKGCTWIGFTGIKGVARKVEHAKNIPLAGYFLWHIGGDDNGALSKQASDTWDTT